MVIKQCNYSFEITKIALIVKSCEAETISSTNNCQYTVFEYLANYIYRTRSKECWLEFDEHLW